MKRILAIITMATAVMLTASATSHKKQKAKTTEPEQPTKADRIYWSELYSCDSTALVYICREWEAFTRRQPHNEVGWRNFYEADDYYRMRYGRHITGDAQESTAEHHFLFRQNLQRQMLTAIPDTYTYYYIALDAGLGADSLSDEDHRRTMYGYTCQAQDHLPDDVTNFDLSLLIGRMMLYGDTVRMTQLLQTMYDRGLCPAHVLQYHFNELQGMPEGALYIGNNEGDIIPKLIIQYVLRQHCDKLLYNQNFSFDRAYNNLCLSRFGISQPDYDEWMRTGQSWNQRIVQHLCQYSARPVFFSANSINMADWLTDELRGHLYNEGLTMRYSAVPYDNSVAKRRNINERYLMEYLLYPFQPARDIPNQRWEGDDSYFALNYVILLQDQLPWYEQNDRDGYDRLARILRRILKQNAITDVAEEDIPLPMKLPRLIFFSEPDTEKPDSTTMIYHDADGTTYTRKVIGLPEGMSIDDAIDIMEQGSTVKKTTDENGNSVVTKTEVRVTEQKTTVSWQKK